MRNGQYIENNAFDIMLVAYAIETIWLSSGFSWHVNIFKSISFWRKYGENLNWSLHKNNIMAKYKIRLSRKAILYKLHSYSRNENASISISKAAAAMRMKAYQYIKKKYSRRHSIGERNETFISLSLSYRGRYEDDIVRACWYRLARQAMLDRISCKSQSSLRIAD